MHAASQNVFSPFNGNNWQSQETGGPAPNLEQYWEGWRSMALAALQSCGISWWRIDCKKEMHVAILHIILRIMS